MKKYILYSLLLVLTLSSCKNKSRFLSSITGSAYEILVVVDKAHWKAESGHTLYKLLESDIVGLPQAEPNLSVSWCTPEEFNSMLKPTRNIILTDINDSKYTKGSIKYTRDKWASPQAVARLSAPDDTTFIKLINEKGQEILNFFIQAERNRHIDVFKDRVNGTLTKLIYDKFGISMVIPDYLNKYKYNKDTLWISTGSREARQDLLIYSYPYTDKNMLTLDALLKKRDSIVGKFIPGPVDGSYMGTEYKYDKPAFREIWVDGKYCAEVRGLWRMFGNTLMGGPFVSLTRVDELNGRVITVEGFVYAPSIKKRSYLRQMESLLYTVKLPVVLDDVVVSTENKKAEN